MTNHDDTPATKVTYVTASRGLKMEPMPGFEESLLALDDSEGVQLVVQAMLLHALFHPFRSVHVGGSSARAIVTMSVPDVPALLLVYRVKGETLYLYRVVPWDEMSIESMDVASV